MTTPYKILALSLLLAAAFFVGWCSFRDKDNPAPVTPARSEAERVKAVDIDSIQSQHEAEKIAAFNSGKQSVLKDLNLIKQSILDLKKNAQQNEREYGKQPTLAKCDTLLKQKSEIIGAQDEAIAKWETVNAANDSIIGTQGKAIQRKDMVIGLLNDNLKRSNEQWQETTEELVKARKPKRWGIGLNVGYGVSETGLTPYIGGGVSYNIIRL